MDVDAKPVGTALPIDRNGTTQNVSVNKNDAPNAETGGEKVPQVAASSSQESGQTSAAPGAEDSDGRDSEAISDRKGEGGDETLTFGGIKAAVNEIDDNLDDALGHAADSIWSFATSVTGKVTSVVKDGPPDFENLRKNVTTRLAPLDHIGRDLSSHISALAPNEAAIANITGSVKSVAESVQRNAQAMEAAILAKANMVESTEASRAIGESGTPLDDAGASEVAVGDPAMGVLPLMSVKGDDDPEDVIDVNEEIAKVGETITNSFVGQTVGDIWTGLWGNSADDQQDDGLEAADVPKTRFEKRIFELEANPDTYCEPAKDLDAFAEWSKSFVLDENADNCIAILDRHESIAELYERVVPRIVEEDTFWMRYFFARHVLEKEEERRKRLLERAENTVAEADDDEDGWGDDDWDDDTQVQAEGNPFDGKAEDGIEGSEAVDSESPSFTGHEEEAPKGTTVSGEAATNNVLEEEPNSESQKTANAVAASKPVKKVEVVSTPDDDWGDDDWE